MRNGLLPGLNTSRLIQLMRASTDLPSTDPEILSQGTGELPAGKRTGWVIPDWFQTRHDLRLGPAQALLPKVHAEVGAVDVFLHDSDHSYTHMMFEMSLAWHFVRPGGWILADNIEQNQSFADFVRATGGGMLVVSSYVRPERIWQHGITQKPSVRA